MDGVYLPESLIRISGIFLLERMEITEEEKKEAQAATTKKKSGIL